ncbi:gamma carbonic anhydrase family protein [Rhodococcus opacus]|uniref:Gamma carbonic anhydrase family protein n=1 Tax=Rhodococcus opacus TaxID=37919 RepID=A0A2S8IPF7_RHOOP|nr:gamma carbonic anhydrase family protein [Rhodococcus opacus]PQP16569.1 gamma carbonic anhydrase family protein [Rhodococcus opacus]
MTAFISINGHEPTVAATAWVAPNATLIGDTHIGDESGVWYNAVVRADADRITIGARTNIQDGCVLHADPGSPLSIGCGVSVGHNAVLHGCTIDDDVLIGMGAIVMNNARIGSRTIIAAGALVPEGVVIEPNSLVAGIPGKVRRSCTEGELDQVRRNADNYVKRLTHYR